jgi:hypothetical protein
MKYLYLGDRRFFRKRPTLGLFLATFPLIEYIRFDGVGVPQSANSKTDYILQQILISFKLHTG